LTPTPGLPYLPRALLLHDRRDGLAAEEGAGKVHFEDKLEKLEAHLVEGLMPRNARVVDEDIDSAELRRRLADGIDGLGLVRHVDPNGDGLRARGIELARQLLRRLEVHVP
jgi:hypothetical protein